MAEATSEGLIKRLWNRVTGQKPSETAVPTLPASGIKTGPIEAETEKQLDEAEAKLEQQREIDRLASGGKVPPQPGAE